MIGYKAMHAMFDGHLREAQQGENSPGAYARGRMAALREFFDDLGMGWDDRRGPLIELDQRGMPVIREGVASPREYSFAQIGEAIFGIERFRELYHPDSGINFGLGEHLREAAIGPEAFIDINAYNLTISGLLNAEVMKEFMSPEFLGKNLITIKPTKMNGQAIIGITGVRPASAAAKGRQPGETHAAVGVGSAKQTTPVTVEQALKIEITREVPFYDQTGDVLDVAKESIGYELGYGQEKDIADVVMGVVNNYNRNGTSNNTYQTATPWINDHSNAFSDETDVDDARQLFTDMTHPETGREIVVDGRTILCMPQRELKFSEQLYGSTIQLGTQLNSNFPSRWKQANPQLAQTGPNMTKGPYTIIPLTSIWYNRATAADGLNLSAANAKEYWWMGDFDKAFWWMENWPFQPWTASADEMTMKDRGLILVYGANYRGVAYSREPRYVVRSKN